MSTTDSASSIAALLQQGMEHHRAGRLLRGIEEPRFVDDEVLERGAADTVSRHYAASCM